MHRLLLLCGLLISSVGYTAPRSIIIGSDPVYKIDSYEPIYDLTKLPFDNHKKHTLPTQWQKLTILNTVSESNYVLEFIDFRIDDIELYVPLKSGGYKKYRSGDLYYFTTRPIKHKNLVFELPSVYNIPYSIYFKTTKAVNSSFVLNANIRSYANFASYGFQEYAFLTFFYGILFCMSLYNLIRFLFTKDYICLSYVFYIIALSLFSLSRIDGLGFHYLWPELPIFNNYAARFSLMLFVLLSITFATLFLEIPKMNPRLFKMILCLMLIRILTTLFINSEALILDIKIVDLLVMIIVIIPNFINKIYFQNFSYLLFLGAYCCMLLGFLIYTLQDYSLIPHSFISYYGLNIGVFVETILLSMAISEKTRLLMVEKQNAQARIIHQLAENKELQNQLVIELKEKECIKDKINKELEEKVVARTVELEEKNILLLQKNLKIEALASEIDKQYYFLKKETVSNNLDLLWTKHISFDQFKESFPDEISCLVLMEKLKWGRINFSCTKCSYENFTKNSNTLSRKCNRCTHIESVTANTLFHGLKFPLQKALYLTYFSLHGIEGITISLLASNIELRFNTCSAFISKVRNRILSIANSERTQGQEMLQRIVLLEKFDKN